MFQMSIQDDYSDAVKLRIKQETLRSDYGSFFTDFDLDLADFGLSHETELVGDELATFETMSRWHKNSHTLKEEWLSAYESIKVNLDVEERMTKLGGSFQQFMRYFGMVFKYVRYLLIFRKKFASSSSSVLDRFTITPMLEMLEENIRVLYESRLCGRVNEDEFDVEKPYDCTAPQDILFYEHCFLPAGIFLTYKEIHPMSNEKRLLEDIFTLGSGSKTKDLIPETNAICVECASVFYPYLREASVDQVSEINKQVFKEQQKNQYLRPYLSKILKSIKNPHKYDSEESVIDDSVSENKSASKFSGSEGVSKLNEFGNNENGKRFNPFSSDEEFEADIEPSPKNTCEACLKSFSLSAFLAYHNKIFHGLKSVSNSVKVASKFVSEAEELITTFVAPDNSVKKRKAYSASTDGAEKVIKSSKVSVVKNTKSSQVSVVQNPHKFNLREKSRRNLKFGD